MCVCFFNYQTKDNYNEADICSSIIVSIIINDMIVIFFIITKWGLDICVITSMAVSTSY